MTLSKRRQPRPIESVELKIAFKADRETAARIKRAVPSAVLRGGGCEVVIEGTETEEVADSARDLLEKLRKLEASPGIV
jgi:hypothetical protein